MLGASTAEPRTSVDDRTEVLAAVSQPGLPRQDFNMAAIYNRRCEINVAQLNHATCCVS
jgi:hypothetical protein